MLKNSHIIQAWQHLTLRLLYSERLDGARLLAIIMPPNIARMLSLFVLRFVSSTVNLILGIEIQHMNGCVGHNKLV